MQSLIPEHVGLLEFSGPDARSFLQSQLATDLRPLSQGRCRHAAALAANGRVLAAGGLLAVDGESFLWLLDAALIAPISAHLRRYLLRSKLRIEARSDLKLSAPVAAAILHFNDAAGRELAVANVACAISPDATQYARQAIVSGLLDFQEQHADRHLPQALGLHRTTAIALDKGCYPGQEIVARTHYLGRVKRGLARYRCNQQPDHTALHDPNQQDIGEILNCLANDDHFIGLSTLQLSAQAIFVQSGGIHQPAELEPLD